MKVDRRSQHDQILARRRRFAARFDERAAKLAVQIGQGLVAEEIGKTANALASLFWTRVLWDLVLKIKD